MDITYPDLIVKPTTLKTPLPAWASACRARRDEIGISQEAVSARTFEPAIDKELLAQRTVSDIERGIVSPLDLSGARFFAYLDALNWTPLEFSEATGLKIRGHSYLDGVVEPYEPAFRVEMVGDVAAGAFGIDFDVPPDDYLVIDDRDLPRGTNKRMLKGLRVHGDSMIDDGILGGIAPGSKLVIELDRHPQEGDICVAWVSCPLFDFEGRIVKVYHEDSNGTILKSYNFEGPIFRAHQCDEMRVLGTVLLVITPSKVITRHRWR